MAKRRPITAITDAADRPITPDKPDRVPSTVNRKRSESQSLSWEERHKRYTYHGEIETRQRLEAHSKATGESLSGLINRAQRELLEREADS